MKWMLLLILLPFAYAKIIAPTIYEQKDFGPLSKPEFLYSINVDCTASTVNLMIMDEDFNRVEDATSYLSYIDFSKPLISSSKSDKDGLLLHKLPGNVLLMRGLFVLVIEKNGFRNKEVHFDIQSCFKNESKKEIENKKPEPVEREPEIVPILKNESSIIEKNVTKIVEPEKPSACIAIFIPLLLVLKNKLLEFSL